MDKEALRGKKNNFSCVRFRPSHSVLFVFGFVLFRFFPKKNIKLKKILLTVNDFFCSFCPWLVCESAKASTCCEFKAKKVGAGLLSLISNNFYES